MKTLKLFSLNLIAILLLTACSSDDDAPELINEEEVITTVNLYLTPDDSSEQVVFTYEDLDGDGSNPSITTSALTANTTYTGRIEFLNELESPAENITAEVKEEAEEHQVFYLPSTSLNTTDITYTDNDVDGNPIGLEFTLTTGDSSSGDLTIFLIHEGNKFADGASEGILSDEVGGETDVEVTFDVTIE